MIVLTTIVGYRYFGGNPIDSPGAHYFGVDIGQDWKTRQAQSSDMLSPKNHWVGWRENLREIMFLTIQYEGFRFQTSLRAIQWSNEVLSFSLNPLTSSDTESKAKPQHTNLSMFSAETSA